MPDGEAPAQTRSENCDDTKEYIQSMRWTAISTYGHEIRFEVPVYIAQLTLSKSTNAATLPPPVVSWSYVQPSRRRRQRSVYFIGQLLFLLRPWGLCRTATGFA